MKKLPHIDDGEATVIANGLEIHPAEHPDLYAGRDITIGGKCTRKKAKSIGLWKKWLELEGDPVLNELASYTSEDGNMVINIADLIYRVREKARMLPEEEGAKVLEMKDTYQHIRGKAGLMKQKAFGLKMGRGKGVKKPEREAILHGHQQQVLELYGRMFSPQEVHRVCVEEWKITCSLKDVVDFREKHLKAITGRIEEFKRSFEDIRLAIKKGRIEELVWIYTRVKDSFIATGSKSDRDFLVKALEQLRKETEGDVLKVEGDLTLKVEVNVNVHLQKEVINKLNLTQIIIGRVCSRMEKQPMDMIKQLSDSAYHRFNGLTDLQDETQDVEYEDLTYPSSKPYDFHAIEKAQNEKRAAEEQRKDKDKAKRAEEIERAEKQGGKSFLLSKIKEMKETNSARAAEVHQMDLEKQVKEAEQGAKTKKGKTKVKPKGEIIDPVKDGVGKAATLELLKKAAKNKDKKK